ncbi:MAG: hypothetical protein JXB32_02745 [Deltaproteobacteria bacterium]|nr:hypothetical protein [Deltaproteobacteria bacterium]
MTRRWLAVVVGLLGAGVAGTWGCGEDADPVDAGPDGEAGADADADADADLDADAEPDSDAGPDGEVDGDGGGGAMLEVVVEQRLLGHEENMMPAAGALVSFDTPGGVRLDGVTDADGRVRFEGFEWAGGGTGTLSAYSVETTMIAWVGLTEAYVAEHLGTDGAFHLVRPGPAEGTVRVSGTLHNMVDPANRHLVSSNRGGSDERAGADWALDVISGRPFTIVACEYPAEDVHSIPLTEDFDDAFLAWGAVTSEGVTEPTTIDIDLTADPLPTGTFRNVLTRPSWLPDDFSPYVNVFNNDGTLMSLFLGSPTHWEWTSADTVEFEVEYADLGPEFHPRAMFNWLPPEGWSGERRIFAWAEAEHWEETPRFLHPLTIVEPVSTTRVGPGDAVEWEGGVEDLADESLFPRINVSSRDSEPLAIIWIVPGLSRIVLPDVPTGVDPSTVYRADARGSVLITSWNCRGVAPSQGSMAGSGHFYMGP